MKKLLLTLLFGFILVLGACGGGGEDEGSGSSEEGSKEGSTEATEVAAEASASTIDSAEAGDVVEVDFGSYEIVKAADNVESFETEDATIDVVKAYLAEFTPSEDDVSLFESDLNEDGVINVAVTVIDVENSGEEYVTFSPFAADVFVEGSKPYGGQMGLNTGDSDISAGKSEQFVTAYNLEDEDDLNAISELTIEMWSTRTEESSPEDLEFTAKFE